MEIDHYDVSKRARPSELADPETFQSIVDWNQAKQAVCQWKRSCRFKYDNV